MRINKKIRISLALVLLAAVIATVAAVALGRRAERKVQDTDDDAVRVRKYKNILLLGLDEVSGLCDVMMLVNVNFANNSVTVAQIPRDTCARYTDSGYKKLNGAYNALGGAEQTARFIEKAFGVTVHHYACITLDTLGQLVDAIGGVELNIPQRMYYSDPAQGLYIDLEAGPACLDGDMAQQFVRYRSGYASGDLGRMDAQKLFIAATFKKLSDSISPRVIVELVKTAENVETDMALSDMAALGLRMLDMKPENISLLTLPGGTAIATQSGANYFVLSALSCSDVMRTHFNAQSRFDKEGLLRNNRYQSFLELYESESEYCVTSIGELVP